MGTRLFHVIKDSMAGFDRNQASLKIPEVAISVTEKILIVDDSTDTLEMMAKLFEFEAYKVETAEDGAEGLFKAVSEKPDLIITDINMPRINGIEMITRLRQNEDIGEVPILAITAYGSGVATEAIQAGANMARTKPIEFDILIEDVRVLLSASDHKNGKS